MNKTLLKGVCAVLFGLTFCGILESSGPGKASVVLTARDNGTEPQTHFTCTGKIHGYVRLPERSVGKHLLEGIWKLPKGQVKEHSRTTVDFAAPGRSTAYVWLEFPEPPVFGSLDPAADQEKLTYNGVWELNVRWDEQSLLVSTFTVRCP